MSETVHYVGIDKIVNNTKIIIALCSIKPRQRFENHDYVVSVVIDNSQDRQIS